MKIIVPEELIGAIDKAGSAIRRKKTRGGARG